MSLGLPGEVQGTRGGKESVGDSGQMLWEGRNGEAKEGSIRLVHQYAVHVMTNTGGICVRS